MTTAYSPQIETTGKPSADGYKSFVQRWDSWTALTADAERGLTALDESERELMPSRKADKYDDTFHFKTYGDALKASRHGWTDGTSRLLGAVDKIADRIGDLADTIASAPVYDVAGELPDMGLYCAGEIEHMLSWPIDENTKPVIRLSINCAKPFFITSEQSANWGAAIIALIDALELAGRDVELVLIAGATSDKAQRLQYLTIKHAGEQIDRDRLAFALLSADMLRRVFLGAIGTDENLYYSATYGKPADLHQLNKLQKLVGADLNDAHQLPALQSRNEYLTPEDGLTEIINWATTEGLIA